MSDETNADEQAPDPLVVGVKRAAVHLGKAGFEVVAALGALGKGVRDKVKPEDGDAAPAGGPQHVPVD